MLVRMQTNSGGGGATPLQVIAESQTSGGISLSGLEAGHEYYLALSSAGTSSSLVISAVTIASATDCTYEALSPARWQQISSMGVAMSVYKIVPTSASVTLTQGYNFYAEYTLLG